MGVVFLIMSGCISVCSSYGFFVLLKKYRIFTDTPKSKIQSAPQGYNILHGKPTLFNQELVKSPLTKRKCCWYSYRISIEEKDSKGETFHKVIETGKADDFIGVTDKTGSCVVLNISQAEMVVKNCKEWSKHSKYPISTGQPLKKSIFDSVLGISLRRTRKYYYDEIMITPKDHIYIAGFFKTQGKQDIKNIVENESWDDVIDTLGASGRGIHTIGKQKGDLRPFVITTDSLEETQRHLLYKSLFILLFAFVFGCVAIIVAFNL